ncbi:MAG: hypothetical protein AAB091_00875 [Elusimicrobiota bacterium]
MPNEEWGEGLSEKKAPASEGRLFDAELCIERIEELFEEDPFETARSRSQAGVADDWRSRIAWKLRQRIALWKSALAAAVCLGVGCFAGVMLGSGFKGLGSGRRAKISTGVFYPAAVRSSAWPKPVEPVSVKTDFLPSLSDIKAKEIANVKEGDEPFALPYPVLSDSSHRRKPVSSEGESQEGLDSQSAPPAHEVPRALRTAGFRRNDKQGEPGQLQEKEKKAAQDGKLESPAVKLEKKEEVKPPAVAPAVAAPVKAPGVDLSAANEEKAKEETAKEIAFAQEVLQTMQGAKAQSPVAVKAAKAIEKAQALAQGRQYKEAASLARETAEQLLLEGGP